jgi:hypothetical protein
MQYSERLIAWQQQRDAADKKLKLSTYLQSEATALLKAIQGSDDLVKYAIALDKTSIALERALKMEAEAIAKLMELLNNQPEDLEN